MTSLAMQRLRVRVEEEVSQILISQVLFRTFLVQIFLMIFLKILAARGEEDAEKLMIPEAQT